MSLKAAGNGSATPPESNDLHLVPEVSVIIPAYNAEATLADTLNSVLSQTLRNIEAIVIDDGSTDTTPELARSFAALDPRVRVIVTSNSGVADARNAGIRAARAQMVAAIDSDDLWHPTFLEKVRNALVQGGEECLFAFASFRRIDMQGRVFASARIYNLGARAFNRFLIRNFVGNGSGMMFRRDAALAVGCYERRLQHEFGTPGCEDWLLQLRLAARGTVAAVGEYLVGYRRVPGAMSSNQVMMLRSRIHAFQILFDELDCAETPGARWGLGRANAECMIYEFLDGQLAAGWRSLRRALVLDPMGMLDVFLTGFRTLLSGGVRRVTLPLRNSLGQDREGQPFLEYGPREEMKLLNRGIRPRRLAKLDELGDGGAFAPAGGTGVRRNGAATRETVDRVTSSREPAGELASEDIGDRAG